MGHPLLGNTPPVIYSRSLRVITYDWLSRPMGFSICLGGKGHSYVRAGLPEIERIDTEVHELKHAEQYSRFKSCEDFDAAFGTLRGRVELEAEAYAAGACASIKRGVDRNLIELDYADRVSYWVARGQIPAMVIFPMIHRFVEECLK